MCPQKPAGALALRCGVERMGGVERMERRAFGGLFAAGVGALAIPGGVRAEARPPTLPRPTRPQIVVLDCLNSYRTLRAPVHKRGLERGDLIQL